MTIFDPVLTEPFRHDTTDDERKALVDKMVDRFLCWQLPGDFAPDCGIMFKPAPDARGYAPTWPVGTNLFTAEQARAMVTHMLGDEAAVLLSAAPPAESERERRLRDALEDMLAGWRYIRRWHGDLYGVGWDRAQHKAEAALAAEPSP